MKGVNDGCLYSYHWGKMQTALAAFLVLVMLLPLAGFSPVQAQNPEGETKTFNISAIDVEITSNHFGDRDPQGKMYVLEAGSIRWQFDLVYAFEASDDEDPWKMFDPAAPAFASDLSVIKPLRGYWIHMTEPGTLTIGP